MSLRLCNFSIRRALVWTALCIPLPAQINQVLTVVPPEQIAGKRNQVVTADLLMEVRSGYHVNSNTPNEEYLIPLRLTWQGDSVKPLDTIFPKPQDEKYPFDPKPLSVFTGRFKTTAKFQILPNAPAGRSYVTGKLRYQACNDKSCLPPKTLDLKVPVDISN